MLAVTHALTGAVIATQINNPVAAIIMVIVSHPLLDLFPHWDFNTRWADRSRFRTFLISALDSGAGLFLGMLLFATKDNWLYVFSLMILAQWADFLEAPYHFGFEHVPFFKAIKRMQHLWHTKAPWPWGFAPQAAIVGLALWTRFFPSLVQAGL